MTAAVHRQGERGGAGISQERKCEGGIRLSSIVLELAPVSLGEGERKKHTHTRPTFSHSKIRSFILDFYNHWKYPRFIFLFSHIYWTHLSGLCPPSQTLDWKQESEKHHLRLLDIFLITQFGRSELLREDLLLLYGITVDGGALFEINIGHHEFQW